MESNQRAGDLLKQARLKQHLSVSECAHRTHIALRYLEALEANRWADLPSESHRQGFLGLYARFLGVPSEEILLRYKGEKAPVVEASTPEKAAHPSSSEPQHIFARKITAFSPTGGQLVAVLIILLVTTWGGYHLLKSGWTEKQPAVWIRTHPRTLEPRLPAAHPISRIQKVHIHADTTSWLRVMSRNALLFEGLLPAQTDKEWTGLGPFNLKIADVRAIHVYWNDQPVEIGAGARNGINSVQLPPTR